MLFVLILMDSSVRIDVKVFSIIGNEPTVLLLSAPRKQHLQRQSPAKNPVDFLVFPS